MGEVGGVGRGTRLGDVAGPATDSLTSFILCPIPSSDSDLFLCGGASGSSRCRLSTAAPSCCLLELKSSRDPLASSRYSRKSLSPPPVFLLGGGSLVSGRKSAGGTGGGNELCGSRSFLKSLPKAPIVEEGLC